MSISTRERELFGDPLDAVERVLCSIVVLTGAAANAALAAAAAVFLYVVLGGL